MFNTRKDIINTLRQLQDDIYSKLKKCWGFIPYPIIQAQTGYFLSMVSNGKFNLKDFVDEKKYNYDEKIKIAEIKHLIKLYLKCFSLKQKWKNKLQSQTLYISYEIHINNDGINIYIHPAKNYFEKAGNSGLILTIYNEYDSIDTCFQTILSYHTLLFKLKTFLSKREINKAFLNAKLVGDYFEKREPVIANRIFIRVYFYQINNQIIYQTMLSFLSCLSPQTIFLYNYENNTNLATIRAANKIGIETIEYQHSTISNDHYAYTKWQNMDDYFYFFPAKFWLWNEFSKNVIINNFYCKNYKPEIICGGNFYLNEQKEELKHLSIEKNNIKERNKNILVCLQGFWIPDFMEKFIIKNRDYVWYFRLHPRYPEDKERLMQLKNKIPDKIEIELANSLSLYELFYKVGFILTSFSGTAIEASYFDVKIIIFGDDGFSNYEEQIKKGIFKFVSSEIELQNIFLDENKILS
jgi:hypothetical protein